MDQKVKIWYKKIVLSLLIIILAILGIGAFIGPKDILEVKVKCPADYCEEEIKGSGPCPFWTNKTGRYYEQKCYDYPEMALSLAECEAKKIIYYKICGVRA